MFETPEKYAAPLRRGDEHEPTDAIEAVRAWRESEAKILVLTGNVGVGKSTGAAWGVFMCEEDSRETYLDFDGKPERGHPRAKTAWLSALHLPKFAEWAEELDELEKADLLVIDDAGREVESPKTRGIVERLVDTRYAHDRPTIITTNCDAKTFKERYGARIADRIREGGLEDGKARWFVACTGPSLRAVMSPRRRPEPEPTPRPEIDRGSEEWQQMADAVLASFLPESAAQ